MKKILVPVDFSDQASYALDFAIEFAEKTRSELILVNVLSIPVPQMSVTGDVMLSTEDTLYTGEFIKRISSQLHEWASGAIERGIQTSVQIKYGNPYVKISKLIAEEEVDWIVMGSKGASGLKEVFMGSNAERMVRFAKCPVIVVKSETHLEAIKDIVFATDLSMEQDLIAEHVVALRKVFGARLHLVKVKTAQGWLDSATLNGQLEDFARRNHLEGCTLSSINANFVDEGAIRFAEEHNADMIVMGTHGKKGLAHFIGGSVAEDVVNESRIPMTVFKIWSE